MGYIILLIIIIICIAGIVEITKKKYPTGVLIPVIILLLLQIGAVLGGDGEVIDVSLDFENNSFSYYLNIFAYYFGHFIWGIISIVLLSLHISHHDKINGNKE